MIGKKGVGIFMFNFVRGKSRLLALILIDLLCMSAGYWLILYRVQFTTEFVSMADILQYFWVMLCSVFSARLVFSVYRQVWRYASSDVYLRMVLSDVVGGLIYLAIDRLAFKYYLAFAQAVAAVSVGLLMTLSARFVYQFFRRRPALLHLYRRNSTQIPNIKVDVAIVGAGELGVMLAKELLMNRNSRYHPTFFFDNDPRKIGTVIEGIKVIGPDSDIIKDIQQLPVQEIILTLPNADPVVRERVFNTYMGTGCKVLVYDYPTDRLDHEEKPIIRDINIEDLLFRKPITMQDQDSVAYYGDKTILITGAGGSIGSELTRQLAKMEPKRLILLDIYENGVYDLGQELRRRYGDALVFDTVIASVCNQDQINQVFDRFRPQIIFHAAAHKHVPLMEENYTEAICNNVFGTLNTVDAAEAYNAERFVLISTDKAVNPTNMMGATKRMCEMIIQSRRESKTDYVAVRFGNVLGSNGSVVPLFKQQIAEGGPVTITDKRIIRYFMTISEAAQLVLRTGKRAERSEIYVLDMGKPIKIFDLAAKLISLSGFEPGKDIEIKEIGLRPGEKMYEELLVKTEDCERTEEDRIFIERSAALSRSEVEMKLNRLKSAVMDLKQDADIRMIMQEIVPTYTDADEVNIHANQSKEIQTAENGKLVQSDLVDILG